MLVIRVTDDLGSFFCGFNEKCSQLILSRNKKNAKIYANIDDIKQDIIMIEQSTNGELSAFTESYDISPHLL